MVGRILRALFYHYIKQRAKLTLKKQDNSSSIMSLQNPLTTEPRGTTIATSSTGTSEKIIMETQIEPLAFVREWSIDRIHFLAESEDSQDHLNALAIAEEFDEWINIPEGIVELNYICLEDDSFGDQEIDVR